MIDQIASAIGSVLLLLGWSIKKWKRTADILNIVGSIAMVVFAYFIGAPIVICFNTIWAIIGFIHLVRDSR